MRLKKQLQELMLKNCKNLAYIELDFLYLFNNLVHKIKKAKKILIIIKTIKQLGRYNIDYTLIIFL